MAPEILILFLLILLNGFFSLSEMAIVSARKARLRHEAEQGKKNYRLALETAENPSDFLSTIQVVITLIGTLTGAIGGTTVARELETALGGIPVLAQAAGPVSIGIVVVVTTFISVVVGELVPKNLALAHPETIAVSVIRPLRVFTIIFKPLVRLLSGATRLIIGIAGSKDIDEPAVTEEEVKVLIAQGTESGVFNDTEREMVEGVLGMEDRRVTSLMTPRTEVVCLDVNDDIGTLRSVILDNVRFGYLPLIDGDLDRIVGMVPVKEGLAAIAAGTLDDIRSLARKPVLVPESVSALKAFSALKEGEVKSALIADEYGGIAGLVAFSDVIESILGDIAITGNQENPGMVRREDGSWLIDGSMGVDRFVSELELDSRMLGSGDYETLAGLVLDRMGSIPKAGDRCTWDGCTIEVVDMDGNRIDKVIVTLSNPETPEEDGDKEEETADTRSDYD